MKGRLTLLALAGALAGCSSGADDEALKAFGTEAVAKVGAGSKLLAACGPFEPADGASEWAKQATQAAKYIAFIEQDDEIYVVDPFVLESHPAITQDSEIVGVDGDGNEIPAATHASNVIMRERATTVAGSDKMRIGVFAVAQNGVPNPDQTEEFVVDKTVASHHATATVNVGDKSGTFNADCTA